MSEQNQILKTINSRGARRVMAASGVIHDEKHEREFTASGGHFAQSLDDYRTGGMGQWL